MTEEDEKKQQEQQQRENAALGVYLHQVLTTIVNGAVTVVGGPPERTLIAMSRIFGAIIGSRYAGEEGRVTMLRALCAMEFKKGIDDQPIQPLAATDAPPPPPPPEPEKNAA